MWVFIITYLHAQTIISRPEMVTQQTRYINPILIQCWASVVNGGPALDQHWIDVSFYWEITLFSMRSIFFSSLEIHPFGCYASGNDDYFARLSNVVFSLLDDGIACLCACRMCIMTIEESVSGTVGRWCFCWVK